MPVLNKKELERVVADACALLDHLLPKEGVSVFSAAACCCLPLCIEEASCTSLLCA